MSIAYYTQFYVGFAYCQIIQYYTADIGTNTDKGLVMVRL